MPRTSRAYHLNKPDARIGAPLVVIAALLAFLLAGCSSTTQQVQHFDEHASGQHFYDHAGILTQAEIADLETCAGMVERTGA